MTPREMSDILNRCSAQILTYEDGDLLLISGVMDDLAGLKREFPSGSTPAAVVEKVLVLLRTLLHGAKMEATAEAVALGFDLCSRLVRGLEAAGGTPPDGDEHADEMARFLAAADGLLGPAPEAAAEIRLSAEPFKIFLSEAAGKVIRAQDLILNLEKNPGHRGHLNELFRIFHTIKGECGFLKITPLGELAHNLENLLDLLRGNRLPIDSLVIDLLLEGIDATRRILDVLGRGDLAAFRRLSQAELIGRINAAGRRVKSSLGELLVEQGKLTGDEVGDILLKQKEANFSQKFGEIAVKEHYLSREELEESLTGQGRAGTAVDSIIKVKSSQINYLVDMVGELLIVEAQLEDKGRHLSQLRKITQGIQYAAMQLRTEKVQNLFISMKRVARDTAKKLQKRVVTELRGEDLEIDRDLVEKLEEPLIHLVRNAVGHGIESEEERLAAGKPPEGSVLIEARRRGNTIVIAVEDDGRGLDRDKIAATAVAKGLIAADDAARLPDAEVFAFIFQPGFSTADNVDLVSGRGVGMDIVKTVTTAVRGRVELKSARGASTRTELVFPLSTAIIDGMIVRSRGSSFIVPVANVIESLALGEGMLFSVKGDAEVIDVRGEIIPIIRLADFFRQRTADAAGDRLLAVIIENAEGRKAALLLEEIVSKREVFIKTLGQKFKRLKGISSGTILPGGRIGFVLDVDEIIRESGAAGGGGGRPRVSAAPAKERALSGAQGE